MHPLLHLPLPLLLRYLSPLPPIICRSSFLRPSQPSSSQKLFMDMETFLIIAQKYMPIPHPPSQSSIPFTLRVTTDIHLPPHVPPTPFLPLLPKTPSSHLVILPLIPYVIPQFFPSYSDIFFLPISLVDCSIITCLHWNIHSFCSHKCGSFIWANCPLPPFPLLLIPD